MIPCFLFCPSLPTLLKASCSGRRWERCSIFKATHAPILISRITMKNLIFFQMLRSYLIYLFVQTKQEDNNYIISLANYQLLGCLPKITHSNLILPKLWMLYTAALNFSFNARWIQYRHDFQFAALFNKPIYTYDRIARMIPCKFMPSKVVLCLISTA